MAPSDSNDREVYGLYAELNRLGERIESQTRYVDVLERKLREMMRQLGLRTVAVEIFDPIPRLGGGSGQQGAGAPASHPHVRPAERQIAATDNSWWPRSEGDGPPLIPNAGWRNYALHRQADKVVGVSVCGLSRTVLEGIVATVAEQQSLLRNFIPVFLTDSTDFDLFRQHGFVFEYLPAAAKRAAVAGTTNWEAYAAERRALIERKWNLAHIICFGPVEFGKPEAQTVAATSVAMPALDQPIVPPDVEAGLKRPTFPPSRQGVPVPTPASLRGAAATGARNAAARPAGKRASAGGGTGAVRKRAKTPSGSIAEPARDRRKNGGPAAAPAGSDLPNATAASPNGSGTAYDSRQYWTMRHQQLAGDIRSVGNCGKSVAQNEAGYRKRVGELTALLRKELGDPAGKSILELGCGIGMIAAGLVELGFDYTGIDISDVALDDARKRCPQARFIQADIISFRPDMRYDVVLASSVLCHMVDEADWRAVIRNMADAVRPGGTIVLAEDLPQGEPVRYGNYVLHRTFQETRRAFSEVGIAVRNRSRQSDFAVAHPASSKGNGSRKSDTLREGLGR